MTIFKTTRAAALASCVLAAPAHAEDAEFQLPDACGTAVAMEGMDHSSHDHGQSHDAHGDEAGHAGSGMTEMDHAEMPEHVRENMRRMQVTMPAMESGMMNADADIAFVCGMIAHHQAAIDMAQIQLEHGEDPQMRDLAEAIIAAQTDEIEDMQGWLDENAE